MIEIYRRRVVKVIAWSLFTVVIFIGLRIWYLEEQGNFHTITPKEAYRSAQMDKDEWEYYFKRYGIRSVLNLRGRHHNEEWYVEEIKICDRFGIVHYDLGLSANKEPTAAQVHDLLCLFETAPRPVLIHCSGGADRTGLASALWKMVIKGMPKTKALKELSIRFGHMPFGPTRVLDNFIQKWEVEKANTALAQ